GFDEVAKLQRPAVAGWINQQMQQYPKSVFIVTSRPKAYKEQTGERLELDTLLWVQEFNANQRKDFVKRWYLCQERYNHGGRETPSVRQLALQAATDLLTQIEDREELQLRDLAKNPLLLNMMLRFHRQYPGADLPKRRVNLYEEICRLQLKDRPNARKLETLLTQCEAQVILQMLALEMMKQRQERLERNDLLQLLARYLQAQAETVEATEFLEQVEQISELLVKREEEYEFAHLSFQEYLAATQIAQQNQEQLLYEYFSDDWWKQTILLYTAQTKKPSTLIGKAMSLGATDLAYDCLQATGKRVDPKLKADVVERRELTALKQTVQESRYQQLEALLKMQQWKDADEETYRLMITTVGKEVGLYFTSEELSNFPCEELRAIDGLWVKYSKGRFGFSVQKDIYVSCGGKLDGKFPGERIWEDFSDRVGWDRVRQKNEYGSIIVGLNPSFSYPRGSYSSPIFPLRVVFGWGWLGCGLFYRTKACEL
ncbi:MAG: GUN4 domain-containing protein, partial [Cyanobacteria bacterium CAN_BIN43]|nr:GUN4 domain-containing protein [Cyanobacteria bacterium CAN_BIN43]